MKKAVRYVVLFMVMTLCLSTVHAAASRKGSSTQEGYKKLWTEHFVWSQSYIVSEMEDLDDRDAVLNRLLKNQEDIGVSLSPYLGEKGTAQVTALLKDHILLAGKMIKAAKNGEKETIAQEQKKWYENANELAAVLSEANPSWQEKTLQNMLHIHLEHMENYISARIIRDWEAEITAADESLVHMQKLADYLAEKN
ncbi:glycosyltransferase [Cytobacillus gottheilii]|uniref:glycosyltransferase n=1 Tax=Cytobacillus gottheilii TaxID=859144 RepID=UPI0024959732|nr:glycosyltransferase [Cytobacillus gottheilii]